jgi:hypothetical protein
MRQRNDPALKNYITYHSPPETSMAVAERWYFWLSKPSNNYHMKKFLLLSVLLATSAYAISQSGTTFSGDADKAFGLIKNGAFKNGYKYLIKFAVTNQAAISVSPNTSYLIFFVYDNSHHPAPDFKAHLMTPDSALMKKYTIRPFDRAQIGVARAAQLEFRTPPFSGETRPVKLEAKPKANIYVFYKN